MCLLEASITKSNIYTHILQGGEFWTDFDWIVFSTENRVNMRVFTSKQPLIVIVTPQTLYSEYRKFGLKKLLRVVLADPYTSDRHIAHSQ